MSENPKLFSLTEEHGEKRYTYLLNITFNYKFIEYLTITDHYQNKIGREMITNELRYN